MTDTSTNERRAICAEVKPHRALIDYPIPLDDQTTARIWIPRDITRAEAARIYNIILTTCSDYEP